MKREQLHIWISSEEHRALNACSKCHDEPVARLVRRVIRIYLNGRFRDTRTVDRTALPVDTSQSGRRLGHSLPDDRRPDLSVRDPARRVVDDLDRH